MAKKKTVSMASKSAPQPAAKSPAPQPREISRQEIASRAYALWEQRGYRGGSPEADWLHAEQVLRSEHA
jgi:hypothetical protein